MFLWDWPCVCVCSVSRDGIWCWLSCSRAQRCVDKPVRSVCSALSSDRNLSLPLVSLHTPSFSPSVPPCWFKWKSTQSLFPLNSMSFCSFLFLHVSQPFYQSSVGMSKVLVLRNQVESQIWTCYCISSTSTRVCNTEMCVEMKSLFFFLPQVNSVCKISLLRSNVLE